MSKFSKFKQILTLNETVALLTRLTGEEVNADRVGELWRHCYLTAILCHGSRVVGFDLASTESLFSKGKATPQAESWLGVLSGRFGIFDGVEACLVSGTNGEELYFFIDQNMHRQPTDKAIELEDIKPIAVEDLETYFFSYDEVRRLADFANNDLAPPPAPIIQPLRVGLLSVPGYDWPVVNRLIGLQTDSGEFSMDASTKAALNNAQAGKPLHPSERKSTGQIIAALSAMAGLDLAAPYAADETLRAAAAAYGLELPSSPETVVKFFKSAAARPSKA